MSLNRNDLNLSTASKVYIFSFLILLGLVAVPSFGTFDLIIWLRWGEAVYKNGLIDGFAINENYYPPIFDFYLWLCFKVADMANTTPFYTIKISFLLFTFISTILIYKISEKNIVLTILFYISTLYSCVFLSYMDVYFYVPFIFSLIFLLNRRYILFSIFYSFSFFTKYPPLIIAPFLAAYVLHEFFDEFDMFFKRVLSLMMQTLLPILVVIGLMCILFGSALLLTAHNAIHDPYLSGQALNFNWLALRIFRFTILPVFGLHEWPHIWSKCVFWTLYLITLIVFFRHKRSFEDLLIFSIVGHMCYFSFNTGVHENHLLISCILAIILAGRNKKYIWMALCINLISIINMFTFYSYSGDPPTLQPITVFQYLQNSPKEASTLPNVMTFYKYIPQKLPSDFTPEIIAIFNTIYFLSIFFSVLVGDFQQKMYAVPLAESPQRSS